METTTFDRTQRRRDAKIGSSFTFRLCVHIKSLKIPPMTLFEAIRRQDLISAIRLLDKTPELVNELDAHGITPLVLATYMGQKSMVEVMLEHSPDLNALNPRSGTALMGVSFKGHVEIAKMLIDAGADVNISNALGSTALILAANYGQKEMVELLLKHGADKSPKDEEGMTALDHARRQGFGEIVAVLEGEGGV